MICGVIYIVNEFRVRVGVSGGILDPNLCSLSVVLPELSFSVVFSVTL